MRRIVPVALVAVLLASAYPLLRGQEAREPVLNEVGPADGAIVVQNLGREAGAAWEYRIVSGNGVASDVRRAALETEINALGAEGFEYAGPIGEAAVFKRTRR